MEHLRQVVKLKCTEETRKQEEMKETALQAQQAARCEQRMYKGWQDLRTQTSKIDTLQQENITCGDANAQLSMHESEVAKTISDIKQAPRQLLHIRIHLYVAKLQLQLKLQKKINI